MLTSPGHNIGTRKGKIAQEKRWEIDSSRVSNTLVTIEGKIPLGTVAGCDVTLVTKVALGLSSLVDACTTDTLHKLVVQDLE